MKRKKLMGVPRLIRRRARGQSIPLIALMIVVLVAMVGLSVDVGNTFAEERKAVAAANAAAIAGMNTYLQGDAVGNRTNDAVAATIDNTLKANGIDQASSNLDFEAVYLDQDGAPLEANADVMEPGEAPDNVAFLQVRVSGKVDTFFARVVNRPDLPINATGYAGTCPVGNGVYPIAVNLNLFNSDVTEFAQPSGTTGEVWQRISDGPYAGYTMRRMSVHDNLPGGFSWLRWTGDPNAGNAGTTQEAMSGYGSLSQGYQEVPDWPSGSVLPEPNNYPEQPGLLNPGDWLYGNSGFQMTATMRGILDGHIANGSQLILPIYDDAVGSGVNGKFHANRFGLFVITDYGRTQSDKWLELIYLGPADLKSTACAVTPPETPAERLGLEGQITFDAAWAEAPTEYQPVQYVVVFDASGSMNANFAGQGMQGGRVVQCTNGPPGAPANQNCGNPQSAWTPKEERRIYIAKEALKLLISRTNMPGNSTYNQNLPKDEMAFVWFNDDVRMSNVKSFRSDPAAIIADVMAANSQSGDPYKSAGGTNGAGGLYRAANLLQNEGRTTTELGRTWTYKPVVLFITDGVSNKFLDITKDTLNGGSSDANTYPANPVHFCRTLGQTVVENASCQTNDGGAGPYQGKNRPITEMVRVSTDLIKSNPRVEGEVFVLALSHIPDVGLEDGVASTSQHFYNVPNLERDPTTGRNLVEEVMLDILGETKDPVCETKTENGKTFITGSEFAAVPGAGLSYPGTVGFVTVVHGSTGVEYTAPIEARVANGKSYLWYEFEDLPRGTYTLSVKLWYKHPNDKDDAPRQYDVIYRGEQASPSINVNVDRDPQSNSFRDIVTENLHLDFAYDPCFTSTE